jgi:hypothetical protein
VRATSAYNTGKYRNSPIGCRPKEGQVVQKTQASRGVVFFVVACLALFAHVPLDWHFKIINSTWLDLTSQPQGQKIHNYPAQPP